MEEIKTKVLMRSHSVDGEESAETVWADLLSADTYRNQNIPFFSYGICLQDVVLAPVAQESGMATFERVISKSGNRTLRLLLRNPIRVDRKARAKLQELAEIGCDYELANDRYAALNVPASVDIARIELIVAKIASEWERADPAFEDEYFGGIAAL